MKPAPLAALRDGGPGNGRERGRRVPSMAQAARRRWLVWLTKWLLPLAAVALLASVALWPELSRQVDQARLSYRRGTVSGEGGQARDARYNGVDAQGQPYSMTATTARQTAPDRYDLTGVMGDLSTNAGGWLAVKGRDGVYAQAAGQLDLSGGVTLYRDDGTTLRSAAITLDMPAGVATSADRTHVEGPFGTLDAQGFTLTDHGQVVRFAGPARLVLNGGGK
jgi:lipopolysaccharide export system protein LptC